MPFLIQGFLFQHNESLGIRIEPIEGAVSVIQARLTQAMFAGAIWIDPKKVAGKYTGKVQDAYGQSILSEIKIGKRSLIFNKIYEGRDDLIAYKFRRVGEIWLGKYTGSVTGEGVCQCVLTKVRDSFFGPEKAMKACGMNKPHA